KAGHRAELTSIRAPSSRFNGNNAKRTPPVFDALKHALRHFWNQIKLVDVHRVPRNRRILLESGLAFLAKLIYRSIDILELATGGILDDLWPRFIGFTEGHGVRMARPTTSTKGLIGHFGNMRSAHHDRHTYGTDSIGDAVRLCYHPGHRADPDKSDVFFAHKSSDAVFIHRLRVAIDQKFFVA